MRILVGGLAAVVLLRTVATGAGVHSTKVEAASGPGSVPLSVHITSPLGRTGLPGAIRIVAQVSHQPNVALAPVKFFVNDVPAGDDGDGPPYTVEWTDANPFEPTRIRVEATDVLGNSASDAIDLAPFEIVETTGASASCSRRPSRTRPTGSSTAWMHPHFVSWKTTSRSRSIS